MRQTLASAAARSAIVLCLALGAFACDRDTPKQTSQATPAPAPAPPAGPPRRGGSATISNAEDLVSVNELVAGGTALSADVAQYALFLRLLQEQPDYRDHPPTFAPRLAESYAWSPDHLTLTLKLRPNVTWSDGVPVTADDVRFTWQAQTNPDIAWEFAYMKEAIRDVEVVDARTVRMHFTRPSFSQLSDANEGVILPKHAWGKLPFKKWRDSADWFRENLVVDGPFTLASWTPQQEIVFARNPKYFEPDLPRLDRLIVRVVPDASATLEQLLAGQLDYVPQLTPSAAERVRGSERARLLNYPGRQYTFICWNTKRPQFAEADVRRALTLAIDRQRLIDSLWHGFAVASSSPVINGIWAHDPAPPLPFDPAEAERLLTARGWVDRDGDGVREKNGQPLRFELLINTGNAVRADAAAMIQEQLKRVGIDARPRTLELNTLGTRAGKHDFDAVIQGFAIDTSLDLAYAFATDSIENGNNWGSYSNPEVDRLLAQIRSQSEPLHAKPMLLRVQQILARDQPFTLLWEPQRVDGASRRLQGAAPNALSSLFNVREWWVAD